MTLSEPKAGRAIRPRLALRDETRADHDRVDAIFAGFDLAAAEGYRRFLVANAAAFLPTEAALEAAGIATLVSDWPSRRRGDALRADLAAMTAPVPPPAGSIAFDGEAEMLGGLYVLEGSRLGGAMLARGLPPGVPRTFMVGSGEGRGWRDLIEFLDRNLIHDQNLECAIDAARRVFALFAAAGLAELERRA